MNHTGVRLAAASAVATGSVAILLMLSTPLRAGAQVGQRPGFSLRWLPESAVRDSWREPVGGHTARAFESSLDARPISVRRAVLYSLLLPGLGDYAMGNRTRAWTFFGAEAAIWTGFGVSRVQGARRETSYQDYAVRFAGVSRTGHSDDFYILLREYDSSVGYEADIKTDGRNALWPPPDPNVQDPRVGKDALDHYFVENRVADYEPWAWKSLDHKIQYQEIRSASKNAYRRSTFFVAAAAANRVIAAIFAYTASRNRGTTVSHRRYQLDFTPPRSEYASAVSIVRRF